MSWMCGMFFRMFFQTGSLSKRLLIAVFCLTFLFNSSLFANEILEFEVTEEEGVYYINASVILHAPVEHVRNVLTDYVHIYRLNPSIIESEVLTSPGGNVARVRTKVIGCVISYCEEIERVEDVSILSSGDIQAKIVAELSQFKSGITLWKVQPMNESSRLSYRATMEPDFFIPPVIGSYIVKAKLQDEITTSFARLEKIASILYEREWNEKLNYTHWNNTKKLDKEYSTTMD